MFEKFKPKKEITTAAAALAAMTSVEAANPDVTPDEVNKNTTEYVAPSNSDEANPQETLNPFSDNMSEGAFFENQNEDSKPIPFEFRTDFEVAEFTMNKETMNSLDEQAAEFVESFTEEQLQKIKNLQVFIEFNTGSDDTPVRGITGPNGENIDNNFKLSYARGSILEKAVKEKFVQRGIYNVLTTIHVPVIEGKEPGVSATNERFASASMIEMTNENMAEYMDIIVLDKSGSMQNDIEAINKMISEKKLDTEIVTLETTNSKGKTLEHHFETLIKVVKNARDGATIGLLSDEKDDYGSGKFNSWQEKQEAFMKDLAEFRKIVKEKNLKIIAKMDNVDDPNESVVFDYVEMAPMLVRGTDDTDTFNRLKQHLEWKMNKVPDSRIAVENSEK